jgi:hypothetical protein
VARALWLAGRALDDDGLRALAVEGMAAVYRRPKQELRIPSATFCHGVAGLLHVTLRFWRDTGDQIFSAAADDLLAQVLAAYDPARPVGYATMEGDGTVVDQAGLLDGAAGVALTLLAAGGGPEPSWDRIFLLS